MPTEPGSSAATQPQVPLQPRFLERYGLTVANGVTAVRAILVPFIIMALIDHNYREAFWLTLIAGASDAIDGVIARTFGHKSWLGAYLDPLADKILIVSIYVTLGVTQVIPLWIVILVVSRDFMIVGAIILSWLVDMPVAIKPHLISKLNTAAQIVFACLVLASRGYQISAEPVLTLVMVLVAVLTSLSVVLYLAQWVRHINSAEAGS